MPMPEQAPCPSRARRPGIARAATAWLAALATIAGTMPATAQQQRREQTIIRDAEVEQLLRDYAQPLFRAAGIPSGAAQIILVGDKSFNAFVANGRKIFVNVGTLMESKTPNEVIGILAHETGHIAGGHLARLRQQIENAQILSVAGMLIGAAAVVGAAQGGNRVGNAGSGAAGAIAGGQELVMRNLLAYQRSEEQAADRAALRFLDATGQSAAGMLTTFKRFAEQSMFLSSQVDRYRLSHPMPQERIASLETLARASANFGRKDPPALQARHDLMRAKLYGFVEREADVLRRYPPYDNSMAGRYARAIAAYRAGRLGDAVSQIDRLISEQPANAYFWELKGQALLEAGRVNEAIPALRRSSGLAPWSGLIRIMLGHALVASDTPANLEAGLRELLNAAQREPDSPEVYRHLATAYGRKGDIGLAELSSAQYYFRIGEWSNARTQASRAKAKLTPQSAAWLKAEDIYNYEPKFVPGEPRR